MIQHSRCSILLLLLFLTSACGKSDDKPKRASADSNVGPAVAAALAGTYQDAENGTARIQINSDNIVVGSTLEIPNPIGDGTRLTPRFPQALIYNAAQGYYSTIGTYNDGTGIFKNVELRLRLYPNNLNLDVTLIIPPSAEALGQITARSVKEPSQNDPGQNEHDHPGQNGKPCQNHQKPDCPVCPDPEPPLIFVYRFIRI